MSSYLKDQPMVAPAQPVIADNPQAQFLGTDARPFDFPPGPAWDHSNAANAGRISNLNEFALPGVVLDAMVAYGLIRPGDRSDRELVKDGIRRALDILLKDKMIASLREHELRLAQHASSWGHGGQGR